MVQPTNTAASLPGSNGEGSAIVPGLTQEEKLALLGAIVESSVDAIISKTLQGYVTSWNGAAQRLFGYTMEEMVGQHISKLIPEDRLNEETEILEKIKKGERVEHFETQRKTKDNVLIDISLTISPVRDFSGRIIGASKIARDITRQKIAERRIRELEERKDDFIRMASHELKTPITSIKGYTQLLQNIFQDYNEAQLFSSRATVRSSLKTIDKQVSRLTRLVSELLDLSRIESGKLEMNMSWFGVNTLVQEVVDDIQHISSRHAILFECDFEGSLYADRDRIGQVLVNLLTNAIKYSPESQEVKVVVEGGPGSVEIRVKDDGIGIDRYDQTRIFERFYRAEGKSEQTYPGFGIGLFIANEIVQRHNGTISVKSEKGKGSEFIVSLPLKPRN